MRKESDIQRAILDYLKSQGIMAWRQKAQGYFDGGKWRANSGTPGLPDIGGVLPGGFILQIEVKAGKGKASEAQVDFIARVNREPRALAFVAWSVDDVIKTIDEWKGRAINE